MPLLVCREMLGITSYVTVKFVLKSKDVSTYDTPRPYFCTLNIKKRSKDLEKQNISAIFAVSICMNNNERK